MAGLTAAGTEASWAEVPGFWSAIGDRTLWYTQKGVTVGVLTHDADHDYEHGRHLIEQHQPTRK